MNKLSTIIGRPWAIPCDPPVTFDCWALTVFVRKHYGLQTPAIANRMAFSLLDRKYLRNPPSFWKEIPIPTPHCVVRMGLSHVGVYLDPGRVLHVPINDGVRVDLLQHVSGDVSFWEVANA